MAQCLGLRREGSSSGRTGVQRQALPQDQEAYAAVAEEGSPSPPATPAGSGDTGWQDLPKETEAGGSVKETIWQFCVSFLLNFLL